MNSRLLKWQVDFETILCYGNWDGYWSFHFWGVTLPTGDRFHSIPICVVVNIHITTQKVVPLASIALPYLSWKSGGWFPRLCFALICWMLWFLRLLSIFLVKGNIMKVWWDCSWLQILVDFLVKRPEKEKDEQWNLICILFLFPWMFLPTTSPSVARHVGFISWCLHLRLSSAPVYWGSYLTSLRLSFFSGKLRQ